VVYPGHGPVTTIGHERKYNPFFWGEIGGRARERGSLSFQNPHPNFYKHS
jgi:hypothetical protein